MMSRPCCGTCKYHEDDGRDWICVCRESDEYSEYTSFESVCAEWEEKKHEMTEDKFLEQLGVATEHLSNVMMEIAKIHSEACLSRMKRKEKSRWTEKDMADAKALKQLMPDAVYVRRYGVELEFLDRDESIIDDAIIITNALPQLKDAQSAKLEDIIGDAGYLVIGGAE